MPRYEYKIKSVATHSFMFNKIFIADQSRPSKKIQAFSFAHN